MCWGRDGKWGPDKTKCRSVHHRSDGDTKIPVARWLQSATRHFIIIPLETIASDPRESAISATPILFISCSPEVEAVECYRFMCLNPWGLGIHDIWVAIGTTKWAEYPKKHSSILERDKTLISSAKCPDRLWWPSSLLFNSILNSLSGSKATGVWN